MTNTMHDLGVARQIGNAGRNVKSATLVRPEFLLEIEVCAAKA